MAKSHHARAHNFLDLTGQVFGRLTVIVYAGKNRLRQSMWTCQCECGTTTTVLVGSLRDGHTRSCGCLIIETIRARRLTHGDTGSPEYRTWKNMIGRCTNPNLKSYSRYGGRGIRVCERWRESYEAFLEDMGRRPSPRHSIERVDNSKGYSPENCRWATRKEQSRNTRQNHPLTHDGETLLIVDWAERIGVRPCVLRTRLHRGWSVKDALTTPVRTCSVLTYDGRTMTLDDWARETGLKRGTIKSRLRQGWSVKDALETPLKPGRWTKATGQDASTV